jgi:hypothetical protein
VILLACKKDDNNTPLVNEPRLIFKFKFDSTQTRLDNLGNIAVVPSNHRTQSPKFNLMSAHYIELAQTDYTLVGQGNVLYKAEEVASTGKFTTAIDFDKSKKVANGEVFFSIPLSKVTAGTYKWLRVSLAYQNYDIQYKYVYNNTPYFLTGTIASFVGYNSFIRSYKIKNQTVEVNGNKLQGYWGFESSSLLGVQPPAITGQAPGTTVVNPLNATSPIPAGSCLVTGQLVNAEGKSQELTLTGKETKDIIIEVSLSTNNSLEWVEHGNDNYFEPANGDTITDMGIRGMIPFIK